MRTLFFIAITNSVWWASCAAVSAHGPYQKALRAKYDYKWVSCYACHAKKGGAVPDIGAVFTKELAGKPIAMRWAKLRLLRR